MLNLRNKLNSHFKEINLILSVSILAMFNFYIIKLKNLIYL